MNDDTTKGTASGNPATLVYYAIYTVTNEYTGPTTDHVYATVVIEYDAIFTEPIQAAQS